MRVKTGISCRSGDNDRFNQGHISSLGENHAIHKTRYLSLSETLDDLRTVGCVC
ncbi:conserved domain protein [Ruminococcus albus 8]|uniref:Conserved domain protein n=1 Tax=Ruminococcus albus 8 TaxID=246199 RepID=E9SFD6_RUMAL|nr:conserved domain protein [Ruminococcus albus 8]